MAVLPFFSLFLLLSLSPQVRGVSFHGLGVNYGTLGDNLPTPEQSVRLIRTLNAGSVKIYDANATIVNALRNTKFRVSIMVPNQLIPSIAANQSAADAWICTNLLPFYGSTRIRYLLVGNEILSDYSIKNSTWQNLVPAMVKLRRALKSHSIRNIKIGTTLAMDALNASFPPSSGSFRSDISESVMRPLLTFLNKTRSFYFVDAYPYFVWAQNYNSVSLDYALFKANPSNYYQDPLTKLVYTNMLDQMLDSVIFAMEKLGFGSVRLVVAETGWPNGGDLDQIGANIYNAATYNRNLVKHMINNPGTPARPRVPMPVFIFSLFNENKKPGPGTERHWGMFYPNGKGIYGIDLSGERELYSYPPLPFPNNDLPYKGPIWCVFSGGKGVNETEVMQAVDYACKQGNNSNTFYYNCDKIMKGGPCYEPNELGFHASYAFNLYWQQYRKSGGTCYFDGLAEQTAKDPSCGSCKFPSSLD